MLNIYIKVKGKHFPKLQNIKVTVSQKNHNHKILSIVSRFYRQQTPTLASNPEHFVRSMHGTVTHIYLYDLTSPNYTSQSTPSTNKDKVLNLMKKQQKVMVKLLYRCRMNEFMGLQCVNVNALLSISYYYCLLLVLVSGGKMLALWEVTWRSQVRIPLTFAPHIYQVSVHQKIN